MPKVLTVNEMIYRTLTTKETKTPKYKEVLELLGFELVKDHGWSHYDYWAIRMKEDDRLLVISQGYDKKKRLYKTCNCVNTNDIAKVDFANLIKTDRSATRWYKRLPPETNVQKYKQAKMSYQTDLSICEDYKKKIIEFEQQVEKAKERVEYYEQLVASEKNKMNEIIAAIKRKDVVV